MKLTIKHLGTLCFSLLVFFTGVCERLVFANENDDIFENQEIAVSPSGALLAVNWLDSISIFDLNDGTELRTFDAQVDTPFVFSFNLDGSKLFVSGWEQNSVWQVATGKQLAKVKTNDNTNCGGFSENQKHLFFDDEFNQFGARQLVLSNDRFKKKKLVVKNSANCRVSPDNKFLALQTYSLSDNGFSVEDTQLQVIDLNAGKIISTLTGEGTDVYDEDMFFFDGNTKLLVRDSSDYYIWDIQQGKVIESWDSELYANEIAFTGSRLLLTADNEKRVFDLLAEATPTVAIDLPENHNSVLDANLSSDGKHYVITSYHDERESDVVVSLFETEGDVLKHRVETQASIYGAQFAKDDSLLVFESYPIVVVDVETGNVLYEIKQ